MSEATPSETKGGSVRGLSKGGLYLYWAAIAVLLYVFFKQAGLGLYRNFSRPDSYYTHGFIVPLVSAYFVWRDREALRAEKTAPSRWGYLVLLLAVGMALFGDLLGFLIVTELAIPFMAIALILLFLGPRHLRLLWFPLAFLVFMIPVPDSVTASLVLRVKLLAAEGAVQLCHLFFLPMIREGSYIHFGADQLLVGEVCGGLRSMISLLALGAIMSYISQTRTWSRLLILACSGPIAVAANVIRIFFLCVVAYWRGSAFATGWVHDTSGVLIYVVAFVVLFAIEALLRKVAPALENETGDTIS
jgi:exosortase